MSRDRFPVRSANPEVVIVAGRFLLNGTFSAAADLPDAKILAGKGYRVRHAGVGNYTIFHKSPGAVWLAGTFVIRAPQGTLYVPRGGTSFGAANQSGMECNIADSSFNLADLAETDSISFIAAFQLSKLPNK